MRADALEPCFKILARVKLIQKQLFEQWAVLETLTPSEYEAFRPALGTFVRIPVARSIARSNSCWATRTRRMLDVFRHDAATLAELDALLRAPSLYDEFLRHLARRGLPVPAGVRRARLHAALRPASRPRARSSRTIYEDPQRWWDAYDMCEKLVDIEESFQLWRFRHMKTVERIIGHKTGTGGSSGVSFLKRALDQTFFPELIDVRTVIGAR